MMRRALLVFLQMTLLCGILYPLLITVLAQLTMYHQANGSLVQMGGTTVGSELIAQKFSSDRYFWPRPSAVDYNPIGPSGGSNLGPTSQKLHNIVAERARSFGEGVPTDMLYASGSGLDPHISTGAALFQIDRVAKARSRDRVEIEEAINKLTSSRRYVNVLMLNIELDKL